MTLPFTNNYTAPPITQTSYTESSSGSQSWSATTQPAIEVAGLYLTSSYQAAGHIRPGVIVQYGASLQISNGTSGVAVGKSELSLRVFVNSVETFTQIEDVEGYTTATGLWAQIRGERIVPIASYGGHIQAYLSSARNFSTSGSSPAQTHYWRNASLALIPIKNW
jgi:hypothetical protein